MNRAVSIVAYLLGLLASAWCTHVGAGCHHDCPETPLAALTTYTIIDAASPALIGGTVSIEASDPRTPQARDFRLTWVEDGTEYTVLWRD